MKKKKTLDQHLQFQDASNKQKSDLGQNSTSPPYSLNHKTDRQNSKQMKRKCEFDDDSLVLLSNKKLRNQKKKRRKVTQNLQKESSSSSSASSSSSLLPSDSEYSELDEVSEAHYSNSDVSQRSNMFADNFASSESGEIPNEEIGNIDQDFFEKSDESDEFFTEKKKQLLDELKVTPRKKKKPRDKQKNVSITNLSSKNRMVALLHHPASMTLYKYLSVEVLSGSISVCGRELNPQNSPIKIFSSERTGYIGIKTEGFEQIWMKKTFFNLSRKLQKVVGDKKLVQNILNKFGNTTVVVLVEALPFPTRIQFLELYYPHELQFKLRRFKKTVRYSLSKDLGSAIEFGPDAENMADEIISSIRRAKLSAMNGPIIFVYGPKHAGKSSLLQFFINKALSIFPSVFYLDADPGQTEFTPPGVVSLTQVDKPMLGPVFCHQQKPISMIFTGSISAESCPSMYIKSVQRLISLFNDKYSSEALFINTMGWLKGIGLECLQEIVKAAQPTILGEVVFEECPSAYDLKPYLIGKVKQFQICSPINESIPGLTPQELRNLALLTYFSKCQPHHLKPMFLNEFRPICISWDKIPIYIFGRKVPPNRIVEAVNASVVALCHVSDCNILVSKIPHFQTTLQEEPFNECIGFGIVRAVDEIKHVLYIITPLDLVELQRVNAIIRGNVEIPDPVILKQKIPGVPLPFTNRMKKHGPDSAKQYRKKIPGRHQKKIKKTS